MVLIPFSKFLPEAAKEEPSQLSGEEIEKLEKEREGLPEIPKEVIKDKRKSIRKTIIKSAEELEMGLETEKLAELADLLGCSVPDRYDEEDPMEEEDWCAEVVLNIRESLKEMSTDELELALSQIQNQDLNVKGSK